MLYFIAICNLILLFTLFIAAKLLLFGNICNKVSNFVPHKFMKSHILSIFFLFSLLAICSCTEQKKPEITPWGTVVGDESLADTLSEDGSFGLNDIVNNGEMIMLTLSGPDTYYDYHGHGMGLQYLLCEKYAAKLGVSLRVEVCKDTAEIVRKIKSGDADIVALQLPDTVKGVGFTKVKVDSLKRGWAVAASNKELAHSLDQWFDRKLISEAKSEESYLLSARSVRRHIYSPMLNRSKGVISHYDAYFQRYAPVARLDWRLMAAQCYQESTFDPNAKSWAGACGLMQIMPSTADHLGLPRASLFNAEENIAASARYMKELGSHFSDVPASERIWYQLASYNGGYHHIRDAMALAKKYGRNAYRWGDVSEFVLKLSSPHYYNDPVVKNGYMRGSETVDYVSRIRDRWAQYRGVAGGGGYKGFVTTPQRAQRNYKWHL